MVLEEQPTRTAVERRVQSVYRRLRLNRVRAALGCVYSGGLDEPGLVNVGSEAQEALNTASAARDQLSMLANLDGSEVPIHDDMPLCPEGKSFGRVNKIMNPPAKFRQKFFVPYLGEEDIDVEESSRLADELEKKKPYEEAKEDREKVIAELKKSAVAEKISAYLTDEVDDSDVEEEYEAQGVTGMILSEVKWERAARRVAILDCIRYFGLKNRHSIIPHLSQVFGLRNEVVFRYLAHALYRSFAWELFDRDDKRSREHKASLAKWIRREERTKTKDLLESNSIPYFSCRQCKVFDCTIHGTNRLRNSDTEEPLQFPVAFDGSRKDSISIRFKQKEKCEKIEKSCLFAGTPKCACYVPDLQNECMEVDSGNNHLNFAAPNGGALSSRQANGIFDRKSNAASPGFEQGEVVNLMSDEDDELGTTDLLSQNCETAGDLKSFIDTFCLVFGKDPCRLAQAVNSMNICGETVTCVSIASYIETVPEQKLSAPVKSKWKQSRNKSKVFMSKREEEIMKQGYRFQYQPCQHEGPCTSKNCSCILSGIACEKYCKCLMPRVSGDTTHEGTRCSNSFSYCACKTGCRITSCNCVGGMRECDPDWCKCSCDSKTPCQNRGLRRGDTVRVVCGHSDVQGWGAYATRPINKDHLIGEYTGEFLDSSDAEEREKLYKTMRCSYLFLLTESQEVDATRVGNKLRYINHSRNPNCVPKVKRVDGDIRVGLYATQHIQAFEELLFNYGDYFASLLDSSKPGKGRAKKRRAVAVPSASGPSHRVPMEVDDDDQ